MTDFVLITPMAIDNASNRCRGIWHDTKKKNIISGEDEGLWTWLHRMTMEAIERGERMATGKIRHRGMKFTVNETGDIPVLEGIARVR